MFTERKRFTAQDQVGSPQIGKERRSSHDKTS